MQNTHSARILYRIALEIDVLAQKQLNDFAHALHSGRFPRDPGSVKYRLAALVLAPHRARGCALRFDGPPGRAG